MTATAASHTRTDHPWSTTGSPPDRSLEQRMSALERANDIRHRRAELKRDVKAGRRDVRALLADPPDYLETMKAYDLLLLIPRWGRVKVSHAIRRVEISPSKTVGGLSARQRKELIGRLSR